MTATERALPSFRKPPLTEVALSVQWEPLPNFGVQHFGLLWEHFRDRFPNVQHHGELAPMMERKGAPSPANEPQIQFGRAPMPRLWFVDANNRELLQIQKDRFARNWRKVQAPDAYPHYEDYIRPAFASDFHLVSKFLEEQGVGELIPNQCEIVYVNQIESGIAWREHSELGSLFAGGLAVPELSCGVDAEQGNFDLTYSMTNSENAFVGRLRISCSPAIRQADGVPGYQLRLAARGWPLSQDMHGALAFLDLGREKIVRAFTELTSPAMHRIWEREDV